MEPEKVPHTFSDSGTICKLFQANCKIVSGKLQNCFRQTAKLFQANCKIVSDKLQNCLLKSVKQYMGMSQDMSFRPPDGIEKRTFFSSDP